MSSLWITLTAHTWYECTWSQRLGLKMLFSCALPNWFHKCHIKNSSMIKRHWSKQNIKDTYRLLLAKISHWALRKNRDTVNLGVDVKCRFRYAFCSSLERNWRERQRTKWKLLQNSNWDYISVLLMCLLSVLIGV